MPVENTDGREPLKNLAMPILMTSMQVMLRGLRSLAAFWEVAPVRRQGSGSRRNAGAQVPLLPCIRSRNPAAARRGSQLAEARPSVGLP